MPETTTSHEAHAEPQPAPPDAALAEESLVEEISIDGMCGVY